MATCPECDADIDVDEFDVDKGDLISCAECGTNLEVTSIAPLELEPAGDEDDDDDDDETTTIWRRKTTPTPPTTTRTRKTPTIGKSDRRLGRQRA